MFNLDLSEQYVAFLDVLGFSELVNNGNRLELENYFNTILQTLRVVNDDKKEIKTLLISDSIILIAPDRIDQLRLLLTAIRTIQCELLKVKILVRGAVSFGEIQYNENFNIVVGKGFINAYLLEKDAHFPCVIIDPKIIAKDGVDRRGFIDIFSNVHEKYTDGNRLIYIHRHTTMYGTTNPITDDLLFVDYINKLATGFDLYDLKDTLHSLLSQNLYKTPHNIDKYKWLKYYIMECSQQIWSNIIQTSANPSNTNTWTTQHKLYHDKSQEFGKMISRL